MKYRLPTKHQFGKYIKDSRNDPRLVPDKLYKATELTLTNYKEPLISIPKGKGFGYYGTIINTNDGKYIQCHICGKLFTSLPGHILNGHKKKVADYKEEFGLAKMTALVSESERFVLKDRYLKWFNSMSEEEKQKFSQTRKDNWKKFIKGRRRGQPGLSLEDKNKRGTCPDQLLEKIREVAKTLGHTPSKLEFIQTLGTQRYIHLIYKTFGSWEGAVDLAGFMPKQRGRGGYTFTYDNEQLLEYLRNFVVVHKKIPTWTDFNRGLLPSYTIYTRRFGSIENAREEAELYELIDRDSIRRDSLGKITRHQFVDVDKTK